jgi:hypothetical protein
VNNWATPGSGCHQVMVMLDSGQALTTLFNSS